MKYFTLTVWIRYFLTAVLLVFVRENAHWSVAICLAFISGAIEAQNYRLWRIWTLLREQYRGG